MAKTTLIYYSDGIVSDDISKLVQGYLSKSGLPIISVTQEPLDFGDNYCIGKIGRSYQNIQSQILLGITNAKTENVALCEHDTIYPEGYFGFVPPRNDVFYYNQNRVFVIAKKGPQYGMFINYKDSHPNADQLICNRKLLIRATQIRRELLIRCDPKELPPGWGEPGFSFPHEKFDWRESSIPSIDILHNTNFTSRNGTYNKEDLSFFMDGWGEWSDVLND